MVVLNGYSGFWPSVIQRKYKQLFFFGFFWFVFFSRSSRHVCFVGKSQFVVMVNDRICPTVFCGFCLYLLPYNFLPF